MARTSGILVVQDGKIIEQGRHEELLAAKGHYCELWMRQYEDAAIAEAWKDQKNVVAGDGSR